MPSAFFLRLDQSTMPTPAYHTLLCEVFFFVVVAVAQLIFLPCLSAVCAGSCRCFVQIVILKCVISAVHCGPLQKKNFHICVLSCFCEEYVHLWEDVEEYYNSNIQIQLHSRFIVHYLIAVLKHTLMPCDATNRHLNMCTHTHRAHCVLYSSRIIFEFGFLIPVCNFMCLSYKNVPVLFLH